MSKINWVTTRLIRVVRMVVGFVTSYVCEEKEWREHLILAALLGVFFGNIFNNLLSDL